MLSYLSFLASCVLINVSNSYQTACTNLWTDRFQILMFIFSFLLRPWKECDELRSASLCVCLSVCRTSQKPTSKRHLIIYRCYLWPWLVPPLGDNAISYVLPVLWMTSCFHMMEPMISIRRCRLVEFARYWNQSAAAQREQGRSLLSSIALFR